MTDRIESISVIRQEISKIIGNLIVDLLLMLKREVSLLTAWSNGQQTCRWSNGQVTGQPALTNNN